MAKPKAKIHLLNFNPNDISSAIAKLQELNTAGDLSGLLFVAKVKGKKRPVLGAAGCCTSDRMMAMGAAAHLLRAVTDLAIHDE